jgi:hypothetical protein
MPLDVLSSTNCAGEPGKTMRIIYAFALLDTYVGVGLFSSRSQLMLTHVRINAVTVPIAGPRPIEALI